MSGITRKDYGSNAVVADNNETLKRAVHVNEPFSLESTGALRAGDYVASKDISYATVTQGMRVLTGNAEGIVKSVTTSGVDPNFVLETVTITYQGEGDATPREETKTVAALKASGNYFFVKNN